MGHQPAGSTSANSSLRKSDVSHISIGISICISMHTCMLSFVSLSMFVKYTHGRRLNCAGAAAVLSGLSKLLRGFELFDVNMDMEQSVLTFKCFDVLEVTVGNRQCMSGKAANAFCKHLQESASYTVHCQTQRRGMIQPEHVKCCLFVL